MTQRVRWFRVEPVARLFSGVASAIARQSFNADAADGFVAESVSRGRIHATFIERLPIEERIEDPFGKVAVYRRVDYRRTEFFLQLDFPQLRIKNAPRTLRSFFTRLGELGHNEIAIEPVRLNVMSTISELEKSLGRISVNRVAICGYPLSARAGADIVVSGAEDVREDAKRFVAHKLSTVAAATITWARRSGSHVCEVSTGGISFDDEDGDAIERLVREALDRPSLRG
jgi:hypothetical protein